MDSVIDLGNSSNNDANIRIIRIKKNVNKLNAPDWPFDIKYMRTK